MVDDADQVWQPTWWPDHWPTVSLLSADLLLLSVLTVLAAYKSVRWLLECLAVALADLRPRTQERNKVVGEDQEVPSVNVEDVTPIDEELRVISETVEDVTPRKVPQYFDEDVDEELEVPSETVEDATPRKVPFYFDEDVYEEMEVPSETVEDATPRKVPFYFDEDVYEELEVPSETVEYVTPKKIPVHLDEEVVKQTLHRYKQVKYEEVRELEEVKWEGTKQVREKSKGKENVKLSDQGSELDFADSLEDFMLKSDVIVQNIDKLQEDVKLKDHTDLIDEVNVQQDVVMEATKTKMEKAKLRERVKWQEDGRNEMLEKENIDTEYAYEMVPGGSDEEFETMYEITGEEDPNVYMVEVDGHQLKVRRLPLDGNSLFSTVAHQTYGVLPGEPAHSSFVYSLRKKAVEHLKTNLHEFLTLLMADVEQQEVRYADVRSKKGKVARYLDDLASPGFFSGFAALQALADIDAFNAELYLRDRGKMRFYSKQEDTGHTVLLLGEKLRSHQGSVIYHFDSVLEALLVEESIYEIID